MFNHMIFTSETLNEPLCIFVAAYKESTKPRLSSSEKFWITLPKYVMGLEKWSPQKFHMKGNAGIQIHRAPDSLPGCWSKLL